MVKPQQHAILKGNPYWAISYALSSLRNYRVRNMGIAIVLAIGIALPTTVFVWSSTGTIMVLDSYFEETPFQMYMTPKATYTYISAHLADATETALSNPYIESTHLVLSTVGILAVPGSSWSSYNMYGVNYRDGIKDMRILFVTGDFVTNASSLLDWTGESILHHGEVLVSEMFVNYTRQVHGIDIQVGSTISFDVLTYSAHGGTGGDFRVSNMVVAGIYSPKTTRTLLDRAFPSISRKNWDEFSLTKDSVLGLSDSIMILQSDVSSSHLVEIRDTGYFEPVVFLRGSKTNLLASGAENIASNLVAVQDQLDEAYPSLTVKGLSEIWKLNAAISTYLQSQILTVIVFPVMIMSLMLTVFTSETSISRRKGEISALRAKGASFNQVFATFMWESVILALAGLLFGILLALVMAPLVGSTVGLFVFDWDLYLRYASNLYIPPLALVIAAAISMYLPASYLLHVARRIDVSEIGQPTVNVLDEETEETGIMRYAVGLTAVLAFLLVMPMIVAPKGGVAVAEILAATLVLFAASYLGSKAMRHVTARLSGGTSFILGEKALYLSRSLSKRKAQFIPLLVILTLTLTTTTMMIVQSSSFEATVRNEVKYSIGADIRIEGNDLPITLNKSILRQPGVFRVTPVVETTAQVGSNSFFLEGVNPKEYAGVGFFTDDSFVSGDPESVLSALASTPDGIIISEYYSRLWNKTVGDTVIVSFAALNFTRTMPLQIVGIMRSAPGFGMASTKELPGPSFGSQLGFQVVGEGFALVHIDLLHSQGYLDTAKMFLIDTVSFANMTQTIKSIESLGQFDLYSPATFNLAQESFAIQLFLSGINGLTVIAFVLCAAMGLSAIALFLGSAVLERAIEYAVFRALGGTRRQVVSMVFGEFTGTVVASIAISVILGFIFGYSMSLLTFGISPFSPILGEVLSFPLFIMGLIVGAESIVMLGSCYFPARRASAVDPARVLRNL
ncbi:MAG: ABC transporter permease [Candidatus Thorarchaeota archaeon]